MKSAIVIFGILFYSCITSKKAGTENNNADNKILGRWCSTSNTADYPHLTFREDGYVIFDCKIDTVFGLKYSLDNNYLLVTPTDKPIKRNKILKFTRTNQIDESSGFFSSFFGLSF